MQSLQQFTDTIFSYVDNNHPELNVDQVKDFKEVFAQMAVLLEDIKGMLRTKDYSNFDYLVVRQEELLQTIAKVTKRQIKRAQRNQTRTRSSLLYLSMLNECRFMAVQLRALANDQRNFG
jgi:Na+/phosphate symporter